MAVAMHAYHIYFVGSADRIEGFCNLYCANDVRAVSEAVRLVDGHDVELWEGYRRVARVSHDRDEIERGPPTRRRSRERGGGRNRQGVF